MEVNYTKILARKTLVAFLVLILILCIAALFVRSSITGKLESIAKLANSIERTEFEPQQSLLLLQQAEDNFQQSLLNPDSAKSNRYKVNITTAFNKIDTLLQSNNTDTKTLSNEQAKLVRHLYMRKIQLSDRLVVLRHSFDSLLTIYAQFNEEVKEVEPVGKPVIASIVKKSPLVKADTIEKVEPVLRKKLFGRIKDAISNKVATEKNVIVISKNGDFQSDELVPRAIILKDRNNYSKQLQQLQQRNVKLQNIQKQLISLNLSINNELATIIADFRDLNYQMSDELKRMSFQNYQHTTGVLNKFYLAALILVGIFALLLIMFIKKLNTAEIYLRKENERSVIMAQQKMDLLLHMSHEIRNPLTSIKGFLQIFSKTTLSDRQKEMLNSIQGSSDMLLLTLNDTLDAAKMDNSEFRINIEPFNPNFNLTEVVESMRYSAVKKGLNLSYNFSGEKQAMVLGDGFRLKQILVNLCSNAIKYTAHGTVTINAELLSGDQGLRLDVIDTGVGISPDQQSHLFSKYYQTNSSKGQIGTGLGLYICKQLVERQGGTITVESYPAKGTTFSFLIPYQRETAALSEDLEAENMMSSLNGVSILAVDDHELNLMFLKMMTSKWNINFHQTETAEHALEMLQLNTYDLLLTDIQLPQMNGFELFENIKAMGGKMSKIPVIALSGLSDENQEAIFLSKGFSGFVPKPFVEKELLKQIFKALNKKDN